MRRAIFTKSNESAHRILDSPQPIKFTKLSPYEKDDVYTYQYHIYVILEYVIFMHAVNILSSFTRNHTCTGHIIVGTCVIFSGKVRKVH